MDKYFKINISKDQETGYFMAEVPLLAPCITFGDTIEEAIAMAEEAIDAVIESRLENGYDIPTDGLEIQNNMLTVMYHHNRGLTPMSA